MVPRGDGDAARPSKAGVSTSLKPVLACAVALGILLQFAALGTKSLWTDEIATVRVASRPTLDEVMEARQESERQPPLHYLLLHYWLRLAGTSDATARAPSALLAVASIVLICWLAYRLHGSSNAVYSPLLLAGSPFLLLFGRMARYYSLSLFLGLLSTCLLVESWHRADRVARGSCCWPPIR